ncbi:hypothetical protein DFH11DRAFT_1520399, partial [Phellopilus nigrolimitatus]
RKLAICLRCLLALEAAFMMGILIYGHLHEKATLGGLENGATVQDETSLPLVWQTLFWAAPVAYELLLISLALYKAIDFWKTSAGFRGFTLVNMLIQDQAIYFILIVTISIINVADYQITNAVLATFVDTVITSSSIFSVLGCWLLFHLKEAGGRGIDYGVGYSLGARSMSNMRFV